MTKEIQEKTIDEIVRIVAYPKPEMFDNLCKILERVYFQGKLDFVDENLELPAESKEALKAELMKAYQVE